MTKDKLKPLVYGSIRVEITEDNKNLFYENGTTKELTIHCGNGESFMLNPACWTEKLKEYVHKLDPLAHPEHADRIEPKLLGTIAGIELCSIEKEGKQHIRMKFSGRRLSQFEGKMEKITAWLESNNISHGEADGSKVCIFKCITNPDKELSDFFQ